MLKANKTKLQILFTPISTQDFNNRFQYQEYLNKGVGSRVHRFIDHWSNNEERAVKIYNKAQLEPQCVIDIIRQAQIFRNLKDVDVDVDQYFIKFYESLRVMDGDSATHYCLVMELGKMSLKDFFKCEAEYAKLSQLNKLQLCLMISKGIRVLHTNNKIHRDLKPGNILIIEKDGKIIPKIADFGHSREIDFQMSNMRGTVQYLNPFQAENNFYGFERDIYPLGLIFYQIFEGGQFIINTAGIQSIQGFFKKMKNQLIDIKKLLSRATSLNENMRNLIQLCLNSEKAKEINIQEIITCLQTMINNIEKPQTNQDLSNDGKMKKQTSLPSTKEQTGGGNKFLFDIPEEQKVISAISQSLDRSKVKSTQKQQPKYSSLIESITQPAVEAQDKSTLEPVIKIEPANLPEAEPLAKDEGQPLLSSTEPLEVDQVQIRQNQMISPEKKIEKQSKKLNYLNMSHLIAAHRSITRKNILQSQYQEELKELQKFQDKYKSFQIIEHQPIQKGEKILLWLFCVKYLIETIKNIQSQITNEQFIKKSHKLLLSSVEKKYIQLWNEFRNLNQIDFLKIQAKKLLQSENPNIEKLVQFYRHYVLNISRIRSFKRQDILKLLSNEEK